MMMNLFENSASFGPLFLGFYEPGTGVVGNNISPSHWQFVSQGIYGVLIPITGFQVPAWRSLQDA